jgi:hypothetical protein
MTVKRGAFRPLIETNGMSPTKAIKREMYIDTNYNNIYFKDDNDVVHTLGGSSGGGSSALPDIVSENVARAGTSTTLFSWTPQRVKQAIDSLTPTSTSQRSFFTASFTDDNHFPIVNNDDYNTIIFNNAIKDNLGEFNTNTGIFTATKAGAYIFIINITAVLTSSMNATPPNNDTSSPNTLVRVLKNNGSVGMIANQGSGLHQGTSPITLLDVGDTVKCEIRYVGGFTGGLESVFANSSFSGYMIN